MYESCELLVYGNEPCRTYATIPTPTSVIRGQNCIMVETQAFVEGGCEMLDHPSVITITRRHLCEPEFRRYKSGLGLLDRTGQLGFGASPGQL